jgi:hypothetical protein
MKNNFYATLFFGLCLGACTSEPKEKELTKPDGFFDYEAFENDSTQKAYKHQYKDELYYASSGTNVDSIRNIHMQDFLHKDRRMGRGLQVFANGKIEGDWHERGPKNEAGDLREVDYDPSTDSLYIMSTAGHIWRGHLNGLTWSLVNDKIKFNTNLLVHVKKSNGSNRLIAAYGNGKDNKKPRYSDDGGQTWTLPTGLDNGFYDGWGGPKKILELGDGKTIYYMVHTWKGSPWGNAIEIYKSIDRGQSYTLTLSLNGGGYDFNSVDMWKPNNSNNIYVIDNSKKQFYSITSNTTNNTSTVSSPVTFNGVDNGDIKLTGRFANNIPTFYLLVSGNKVYKSTNSNGSSWNNLGQTTIDGKVESAFRDVWMANPNNNQLYMGGFQLYKSSDESTWTSQYPYWWTYYDKNTALPQRKNNMHVDMMSMQYFKKADNTPFFLILNHAGIYASYDNLTSTTNLCQDGLNVVTLYDHATAADGTIFYGAQDKGTFRNTSNNNSNKTPVASENMTTGDGMRERFFNNGQSWFGFLQNGSMICMYDKKATKQEWWQVPGDDIPGWINPVENHPDPSAKKCYVGGGNLNGGSGSYLIEMEVSWTGNGSSFKWNPTQFNYDFKANSRNGKSVIKALSASTKNWNKLYVATQDASFFYSSDAGANWTRSTYTLPSALLPWSIEVSPTNANKVFICGTGWSNTGVYMSTNGGQTFTALSNQIIQATFFDMVLSPDEKVLYAATSEGPFAYVFEDNSWYSISGANTPFVDFRSVEYIASTNTVRFGTYGRGIWDFAIKLPVVGINNNNVIETELNIFPNPTSEQVTLKAQGTYLIKIYTERGILLKEFNMTDQSTLNTSTWSSGSYLIEFNQGSKRKVEKLIIQ